MNAYSSIGHKITSHREYQAYQREGRLAPEMADYLRERWEERDPSNISAFLKDCRDRQQQETSDQKTNVSWWAS